MCGEWLLEAEQAGDAAEAEHVGFVEKVKGLEVPV